MTTHEDTDEAFHVIPAYGLVTGLLLIILQDYAGYLSALFAPNSLAVAAAAATLHRV